MTFIFILNRKIITLSALILSFLMGCVGSETPQYISSYELQILEGQKIYLRRCATCHKSNGEGVKGVYPPLANSDWLRKDVLSQAISSIKNGKKGLITVNGVNYNGVMPAQMISDYEITYVLNYIYSSWGNNKTKVLLKDVQLVDEKTFSGLKN